MKKRVGSLKVKLLSVFLMLGIISSSGIGVISILLSRTSLESEAIARLDGTAHLKTESLKSFIESREGDMHIFTGLELVKEACKEAGEDIVRYNIKGDRSVEEVRRDLSEKSIAYNKIGQFLDKYLYSLDAYNELKIVAVKDIFNLAGEIVFKEGDQIYSTNNFTGNVKDREMYQGAYQLMLGKGRGLSYEKYSCDYLYSSIIEYCLELKKPSIHMSHGILSPGVDPENATIEDFICMLIVDIKIEFINDLLTDSTGLGESGETYLVGPVAGKGGLYMLSASRFNGDSVIFNQKINSDGAINLLEKDKSSELFKQFNDLPNYYKDYRGCEILGINNVMPLYKQEMALMTEIDKAEVFKEADNLMYILMGVSAGVLLIVFIVTYLFAVVFTKPIKKVTEYAATIEQGVLDFEIDNKLIKKKDETGRLASTFAAMKNGLFSKAEILETIADGNLQSEVVPSSENDMLGNALLKMSNSLNETLSSVRNSVAKVNLGSDQVSETSQELSQGAAEQASSVEEISSAVVQVKNQADDNAKGAESAMKLAENAMEAAELGNNKVDNLNSSMNLISESSEEIKSVVKIIDDISFQINLLALNANVEAARAGKYGKGFAVVAEEVRNLATRSADALKKTSEMVDVSIKNVESGNSAADDVSNQLKEILTISRMVADALKSIADASREQSTAVAEITDGLEQVNIATQKNTAASEESASTAEELSSLADILDSLVAKFRLK